MRRLAAVLVLVLAGCGGGGDAATPTTTAAVPTTEPAWLGQFEGLTPAGEVDGQPVALDEDERTLYVEDCAVAERLTETGARYGPTPRDANGDSTPGYGSICRQ